MKKQPRSAAHVLLATVSLAVTIVVAAALVAVVNGNPDLLLVGFAIFLVLAAFLLYRRKYWAALATLALPVAFAWLFAWRLMGD